MKIMFLYICIFMIAVIFCPPYVVSHNVNLIGFMRDIRSVSRHTTSFIDCLHDVYPITLFQSQKCSDVGLNDVQKIILQKCIDLRDNEIINKRVNNGFFLEGVTIYTASQWGSVKKQKAWENYKKIPNYSSLKYAYHVIESTIVPKETVDIFNNYFDALIIPDSWAIEVYKKCGVTIPIFSLPLVLSLESLLNKPVKVDHQKEPFIFGFSGVDAPRKNHKLLIDAFAREFGNQANVFLHIHCRFNNVYGLNRIKHMIKQSGVQNITLIQKGFERNEYEEFISALSCYVILSKGEGFSITPREALAAGIPCIVSNNTAQKTMCETGFVAAVKSEIKELAYNEEYRKKMGSMFNCTIDDVCVALRDVYHNHQHYCALAQKGREWTKQYLLDNLKVKYRNLIQPKRVILGDENKITDEYLMTNSRKLFRKYDRLSVSLQNTLE